MNELKQILLSHDSQHLYGLDAEGKIWVADLGVTGGLRTGGASPAVNVVWQRVRNPNEKFTPTTG